MKPETIKSRMVRIDKLVKGHERQLILSANRLKKLKAEYKRLEKLKAKWGNLPIATHAFVTPRSFDFGGEA